MKEDAMNEKELTSDVVITADNELKEMFLTYVGEKFKPENMEVTAEMCVTALAEEFPEFVMLIAEENFLRGYAQSLKDQEKNENEG